MSVQECQKIRGGTWSCCKDVWYISSLILPHKWYLPHNKWYWYFAQNFFKGYTLLVVRYIHITKCNLFSCLGKSTQNLIQQNHFVHPKLCRNQLSWRLVHSHSDLLCHQNICISAPAEKKPVRNTSFFLRFSASQSLEITLWIGSMSCLLQVVKWWLGAWLLTPITILAEVHYICIGKNKHDYWCLSSLQISCVAILQEGQTPHTDKAQVLVYIIKYTKEFDQYKHQ